MRILVYGAGVLGCELAHVLMQNKKNVVTLLARGEWKEMIDQKGLVIRHWVQRKTTTERIKTVDTLAPDDYYDLVFVVVQAGQLPDVLPVLKANKSQYFVFVGNNPQAKQVLEFMQRPADKIAFGFQGTAGRREHDHVVSVYASAGMTVGGATTPLSGTFRTRLKTAFDGAKYKLTFYGDMDEWLKCHIAFVLPACYVCYACNGDLHRATKQQRGAILDAAYEACLMLKDAGIGTYILFQETYHKQSYEKLHPAGPKHDYAWHTEAMDRAMQGGIDDVGLGVLFGLEGYRYEFAALLMHAEHLEAVHGVGPHTISVPRIKKADDIDPDVFDNGIDDETFARICACIRVAVPYTGMIISTRESQAVREKVLPLGVSQISGASRTSVGGYCEPEPEDENSAQFDVSDRRTLDEVVRWLMDQGHIPSFCTACYREGRTGDRFMSLCKSRQILNCCHPNALLTLKEYLQDYASPATRAVGLDMIRKELDKIPSDKVRARTIRCLDAIEAGQRDFRF